MGDDCLVCGMPTHCDFCGDCPNGCDQAAVEGYDKVPLGWMIGLCTVLSFASLGFGWFVGWCVGWW